jgi:hypothetical protein
MPTALDFESFASGYRIKCTRLHEVFGGQWQSGIITPAEGPCIFVVTGEPAAAGV